MTRYHMPKPAGIMLAIKPIIHRCWSIEPCSGGWIGRTVGIAEPFDAITEVGELRLVLKALTGRDGARRGLPIVVTSEHHETEAAA